MEEAYCSYEIAKLLKESGFDERTVYHYIIGQPTSLQHNIVYNKYCNSDAENIYVSPTHQMAMAWLREKKYISIVITDDEIPLSYKYIIRKYFINDKYNLGVEVLKLDSTPFIKYEDAVEAALKYSLENLI